MNITAHTTSVEKLLELAHSLLHSYIIRKPFLLPRVDMGSYDFALGSSRPSFLLQREMTFLISGNAVSPCPCALDVRLENCTREGQGVRGAGMRRGWDSREH